MRLHWILVAALMLATSPSCAAAAPDIADALAGGPDFWRVTGLCLSPKPVLREAPGPHTRRVAYLAAGSVVKNRGCRIVHRARWCEVETLAEPKHRGWIAGNCLREAPGPD